MYGWINDCVEALVLENFGASVWREIKAKAEVKEKDGEFIRHKYYDDASTYALVFAAAEVLNLTPGQVLETFGGYFVTFVAKAGYDKLMRAQGSNLYEFLCNMNSMHFTLQGSGLEQLVPPDFACERVEGAPNDLVLHYWSSRMGLAPMIPGIVKQCATDYFNTSVEVDDFATETVMVDGQELQYTRYYLRNCALAANGASACEPAPVGSLASSSASAFASFPFHIAIDNDMQVLHAGARIAAMGVVPGQTLEELGATVEYPRGTPLSVASLRRVAHSFIKMKVCSLQLHGGVVQFPDGLLFLGNPDASDLAGLLDLNLTLADIPVHDSFRKALFLGEQVRAELQSSRQMEEANLELSRTSSKMVKANMAKRTRNALLQLTAWSLLLGALEVYDIITDWLSFADINTRGSSEWESLVVPLAVCTTLGTLLSGFFLAKRFYGIQKNMAMLITGRIDVQGSSLATAVDNDDIILAGQALRLKQLVASCIHSIITTVVEDIPLLVITLTAIRRQQFVEFDSPLFRSILVSVAMIGARLSQGLYMVNYKLLQAEVEAILSQRRITTSVLMQKQAGTRREGSGNGVGACPVHLAITPVDVT